MLKNIALTLPVNPPGAEPKITDEQLWKCLVTKAKDPAKFIPGVTKCEILKDEGDKVTRSVAIQGKEMVEDMEFCNGTIIYFDSNLGNRITNIISYTPKGGLLLTFSFAGGIPGQPSGGEGVPLEDVIDKIGKIIQTTIDVTRERIKDGSL